MDVDSRTRDLGGRSGRIILLGDGTEVLTDSADSDMFDHDEEDKDLESQIHKGQVHARSEREGTPGPSAANDSHMPDKLVNPPTPSTGTSSTSQHSSDTETKTKAVSDTPLSSQDEKQLLEK